MPRWLSDLLLWVDFHTEGIRLRLFVAAAVFQVFLAPIGDKLIRGADHHHHAHFHDWFSAAALGILLLTSGLLIAGRLLALTLADGDTGASLHLPRLSFRAKLELLWYSLGTFWRTLKRGSSWGGWARLLSGIFVSLMALRVTVSFLRWVAWKAVGHVEDLLPALLVTDLRHLLEFVFKGEQWVRPYLEGGSLLIGALAGFVFLRKPRRTGKPATLREPRALASVDPLIARRDLRAHHSVSSAFDGDLVRQLLRDLSEWEAHESVSTEHGCRDDIADFLRRRGYSVGTECWIAREKERRRVDLLVEDRIPIELKYSLHTKGTGEGDRARSQVECYAGIWGDQGPVILFLAETPREKAVKYGEPAIHWNAQLDGGRAPIVIIADS